MTLVVTFRKHHLTTHVRLKVWRVKYRTLLTLTMDLTNIGVFDNLSFYALLNMLQSLLYLISGLV